MAPYFQGEIQCSIQVKALYTVAPAYLSTSLPTPLPIPPTLQYSIWADGFPPDSPMIFHASILFLLLEKFFFSCLLGELFLIVLKPQFKCSQLCYKVNCSFFCVSTVLPSHIYSFSQHLLSTYPVLGSRVQQ